MKHLSKRILAFFFALLMLLSLAACGEQAEEKEPIGKEVSLGVFQDGTYTNTYAGFACTLDGNWSCLTSEELQELPDNVKEMFAGSELGEVASEMELIADMKAENEEDLTSLNVQYQKHSAALVLTYKLMSEDKLLDTVLEGKDDMIAAYKQAGIEVDSMEKVTVTFAGKEHTALHTEATVQGVPYYTTQIFVFGQGLYGVTLTAASFVTDKTADLLGLFTAA